MSITALSLLKARLNTAQDTDDTLLQHKIDAAEGIAGAHIGAPLTAPLPAPITEAVLMLAAFWYETRKAANPGAVYTIPFGVRELLAPYREAVTGSVAG